LIPHRAAYILEAAALAWMSTEILEMVFGRSNPMLYLQNGIYAFRPLTDDICFASFPSEHGAVPAAVAVRPTPRLVAGHLSPADLRVVSDWIRLNEAVLIDYWEERI
jgi:hypothetical protein